MTVYGLSNINCINKDSSRNIHRFVKTHYEKIAETVKQTNSLIEIRECLLSKFISGELHCLNPKSTSNKKLSESLIHHV